MTEELHAAEVAWMKAQRTTSPKEAARREHERDLERGVYVPSVAHHTYGEAMH